MTKTSIVVFVIVAVVAIIAMLKYSAWQDAKLSALSDCVVETAQNEGYSGNPYSKEAWELFAGSCN